MIHYQQQVKKQNYMQCMIIKLLIFIITMSTCAKSNTKITFQDLWDLILEKTDWRRVEQDDVPPILKCIRERFAESIKTFKPKERNKIMQDDNFF